MAFVTIARIVKTRGVRGEVAAQLLTDFPERFSSVKQVRIARAGHHYSEELEAHWFHQNRVILKFRGRDSPEAVQEMIGGDVQVPEGQRVRPPDDVYFHSDLVGCRVLEQGRCLGWVAAIFETGASGCNLVVETDQGGEFMVPLVKKFVLDIDLERKVIDVELPPGLTADR